MPSRIPAIRLSSCLSSLRISSAPRLHFSTTPIALKKTANPRPNDLVKWAKSEKKRIENLEKRKERKKERLSSRIDPVLGTNTEFVESFDVQPPPLPPVDWARANYVDPLAGHRKQIHLNHYLTPRDIAEALERSRRLTEPHIDGVTESGSAKFVDNQKEEALVRAHEEAHNRAAAAIQRIVSLSIGSRSDKMRVQKARCIDLFGRHVTDRTLSRDPGAPDPAKSGKTPRAGPDTGSSEVQVAILTVKIRNLVRHLELKGLTDKHNKRNLALLVHRRQKLLKYLKRKEKGGVRWRNVMEAIGLDDGAVQGEIMMR
ncbi:unnamed protein product [Tuber melanosporum]|uniref:(Perigord truffle) hypothetical protein n=1 Tax=Tuber melanosporum (strain Mel28) TaxID=656061 RepID=D5GPE7_TUBMM|nr:uncharacterized protein GSTUM_00011800001 [Tuber melanosporum]CAZ86390.1 unnamed protein product [Tuber melanosporum]